MTEPYSESVQLKEVLKTYHSELDEFYGRDETNSFFNLLIEHYIKIDRVKLILEPEFLINPEQHTQMRLALKDLKSEKPIQYIIGQTEFYGLPFKVNENTLIPRPETEGLVEEVLMSFKTKVLKNEKLRILDIGTGSGCIAITLAYNLPNTEIFAMDVSENALNVAKQNAEMNNVEVTFCKNDILNFEEGKCFSFEKNHTKQGRGLFDAIVSNPPYVRQTEKIQMKPNVLDNEPHLALFVENEDPLLFYRAICKFAQIYLKDGGQLFFEINEYFGQEMVQLLSDHRFSKIELKKDIFGKDRMIIANKSKALPIV